MALIRCPECGRERVSDTAITCPDCGYGIKDHFDRIKKQEDIQRQEKAKRIQMVEEQKVEACRKAERIKSVPMPDRPESKRDVYGKITLLRVLGTILIVGGLCIWLLDIAEVGKDIGFLLGVFLAFPGIGAVCKAGDMKQVYDRKVEEYEAAQKNFNEYQKQVVAEQDRIAEIRKQVSAQAHKKTEPDVIKCPKCGCTSIATINRGFSITTGFIGSGSPRNVCQRCGHKWKPNKK